MIKDAAAATHRQARDIKDIGRSSVGTELTGSSVD
jgi:hypothetical protein